MTEYQVPITLDDVQNACGAINRIVQSFCNHTAFVSQELHSNHQILVVNMIPVVSFHLQEMQFLLQTESNLKGLLLQTYFALQDAGKA